MAVAKHNDPTRGIQDARPADLVGAVKALALMAVLMREKVRIIQTLVIFAAIVEAQQ